MQLRLTALTRAGVTYETIADVIGKVEPLPGAQAFMQWARSRMQVAIISDTFYEFGMPMMAKLGQPLLLCHRLDIQDGYIRAITCAKQIPSGTRCRPFRGLAIGSARRATLTTMSACSTRRMPVPFSVRQTMWWPNFPNTPRPTAMPNCRPGLKNSLKNSLKSSLRGSQPRLSSRNLSAEIVNNISLNVEKSR